MDIVDISVETGRRGLHDITSRVREVVSGSGVREGVCFVVCRHTTAGLTINENADPDVRHDILEGLEAAFPDRETFRHAEGNSDAHLKTSCVGNSVTVFVSRGDLVLGTWQGIYLCEFDGPRVRAASVKVLEG